MRKLISLLVVCSFSHSLISQVGAPLLTNFKESKEIENQNWAMCQDANRLMLFANRKGILSFDGSEWIPIRLPVIPYSMKMNNDDGRIYVGGENNYGYLVRDSRTYRYVSLSGDSANLGIITKIIFKDSLIWFYSERSLSRFNYKANKLELRLYQNSGEHFTGMIITPKNTFINVSNQGLYRLESDTLFPIVTGYLTEKTDILFSLPYNQQMVLVGLANGKLSLFDGIKYYDYQIRDDGYLKSNILSEGISVGDSLYAFSTLGGGALVADKLSGKIRYTLNNQNGLPDDEVFAIGYDDNGGLWVSHQYGLTRAALNLPIGNFSVFNGLKGNLTTSLRYNNELYVATSEGVFYLSEVKSYSEEDIYRRGDARTKNLSVEDVSIPQSRYNSNQQTSVQEGSRTNIFTRIFGKKPVPAKNNPVLKSTGPKIRFGRNTSIANYTWQRVVKLKSKNFLYKKVEGLNDKCRQLVSTNNGILAATNRGLFIINNHSAVALADNHHINFISWRPVGGKYSIATNDGYLIAGFKNGKWSIDKPDSYFTDPLYSIIQDKNNILWMGGDNITYRADPGTGTGEIKYKPFIVSDIPQRNTVTIINDTVFLLTETGISYFEDASDSFVQYKAGFTHATTVKGFGYPLSNFPLIRDNDEWIYPEKEKHIQLKEMSLLKLFDDIVSINIDRDNIWIIDGENNLFGIGRKKAFKISPETNLIIKSLRNQNGNNFDIANAVLNRGDNVVNFSVITPSYLKKTLTQYQYFMNKVMPGWSQWSTQSNFSLGIPRSGDFTLLIRARDMWGNTGDPVALKITARAPFIRTTLFYVLLIFVILVIIFLIVWFREKQLQEKNRILEEKVRERTAEIATQKQEITSSIEYASRIQMAMLPMTELFRESFHDYFIIYKPRDIVSGDFYWIGENEKSIFLTVADCTGHGVPGAFMSTLGISSLNEIITHNGDLQANTVLNLLREKIKTSLHQTGKEGEAADGMDISFCVLRKNRKTIQFAGAYNSLYIFTGDEIREYKADRMPIGIHYGDEPSFTNYEIKVKKGDVFYMLSDGFTDQFGGPESNKFKKANLKKLLSEICKRPMADQKKIIEYEFMKWKGDNAQVDDITIIGAKI